MMSSAAPGTGSGEISGPAPCRAALGAPRLSQDTAQQPAGAGGGPEPSQLQLIPPWRDPEACVTCGHIYQRQCDAFDINGDIEQPEMRRSRRSAAPGTDAVLARDSDAVPSVVYPEQKMIGALLSTANGGSSVLCYALQAVVLGYGIYVCFTEAQGNAVNAGMDEPNTLMWVGVALWSSGFLLGALVISSAREALRLDDGAQGLH